MNSKGGKEKNFGIVALILMLTSSKTRRNIDRCTNRVNREWKNATNNYGKMENREEMLLLKLERKLEATAEKMQEIQESFSNKLLVSRKRYHF